MKLTNSNITLREFIHAAVVVAAMITSGCTQNAGSNELVGKYRGSSYDLNIFPDGRCEYLNKNTKDGVPAPPVKGTWKSFSEGTVTEKVSLLAQFPTADWEPMKSIMLSLRVMPGVVGPGQYRAERGYNQGGSIPQVEVMQRIE